MGFGNDVAHIQTVGQSCQAQVVFSADGRRMATRGEQTIRVWDAVQWKEISCLDRSEFSPADMAFSADGSNLWHHRQGNAVYLWDLASASPIGAVQLLSDDATNQESGAASNSQST